MQTTLDAIGSFVLTATGLNAPVSPALLGGAVVVLAIALALFLVLFMSYALGGEKRAWRKSFGSFWRTLSGAVTDPGKALKTAGDELKNAAADLFGEPKSNKNAAALEKAMSDALWQRARPIRRAAKTRRALRSIDAAFSLAGQSALSLAEIAASYPHAEPMTAIFVARVVKRTEERHKDKEVAKQEAARATYEKIRPALERVYPLLIQNPLIEKQIGPLITDDLRTKAQQSLNTLGELKAKFEDEQIKSERARTKADLRAELNITRYKPLSKGQVEHLPTRLVVAEHNVVPYQDISDLAAATLQWARGGDGVLGKLIIGGGGFGKTRLALHVAETLAAEGWRYAGFLSRAEMQRPNAWGEVPVMVTDDTAGVFIVIDYAEARIDDVRQLTRAAIAAQSKPDAKPVRILLLARLAGTRDADGWRHARGDWWHTLLDDKAADTAPERQVFDKAPLFAETGNTIPVAERAAFVEMAAAAIEKRFRDDGLEEFVASPETRSAISAARLQEPQSGSPLMLTLEAFLHVRGAAMQGSPLAEMAREEARHWLRALGEDAPDMHATAAIATQRAVAHATLAQDFALNDATSCARTAVASAYPKGEETDAAHAAISVERVLRTLYGDVETKKLRPVQPDLLGEHVVGETLAGDPTFLARILLGAIGGKEIVRPMFTVLNRATKSVHDAETVIAPVMAALADALPDCLGSYADHIVEAAQAEEGRLQDAARLALPLQPDGIRENTAQLLLNAATRRVDANAAPVRMRAFLADAAAILAGAAATPAGEDQPPADAASGDDLLEQARSADAQAVLLANAGRAEEAHAAAQRALTAYETLMTQDPAAHRMAYAAALGNMSNRLVELDRRDDAWPLIQKHESLLRDGLSSDRENHLPLLAMGLNNLSSQAAALGNLPEAVRAGAESIELNEELAAGDRDKHLGNLAMSRSTYANALSLAGRDNDALAQMKSAIADRRELAEREPDTYLVALATSLHNYSAIAWTAGLYADAMLHNAEANEIRADLTQKHPEVFANLLQHSLERQAAILRRPLPEADATHAYFDAARALAPSAQANPDVHGGAFQLLLHQHVAAAEKAGQSAEEINAALAELGVGIAPTPDEPDPEAMALGTAWQHAHGAWVDAPGAETEAAARAAFDRLRTALLERADDASMAPLIQATRSILAKLDEAGTNPYGAL